MQSTSTFEPATAVQASACLTVKPVGKWRLTTTFGSFVAPTFRNVATASAGCPADTVARHELHRQDQVRP